MGRTVFAEYQRQENHPQRVRIEHRGMRTEARRADRRNERRNRRNKNGTPRITKGSDRKRPLPNKLGAINKEKGILGKERESLLHLVKRNQFYMRINYKSL